MQLKALINNRAKSAGVAPQMMLQNYMLERLIDRISRSRWRDRIIVKGGMLIGSLIGMDRRTTKDLDTTVTGVSLSHETATQVFGEICQIEVDDDLSFELLRTENIREVDDYPSLRLFLRVNYAPLAVPITVDVTTGDVITPAPILYEYPFVFDEGTAPVMAYPTETILAEKVEAILSRNVSTTRIRDFYDVYELWRLKADLIDLRTFGLALSLTCVHRNSALAMVERETSINAMLNDENLYRQWDGYASKHAYASGIDFSEIIEAVRAATDAAAPFFSAQ